MIEVPSSKRYTPVVIDLENKNNGHTLVIDIIGENKKVLEIGTSTGYVSKILKERGNTVFGIEIDSEAAEIASQICEMMINKDIESVDLDKYFQPSSFDVIVCADILEHLSYPGKILLKIKKYLKPEGYIVVSLPNVCHGDVLLTLMLGEFRYTQIGLLDETHLRFFGLKNIVKLFNSCGYSITDLRTTNQPVGSTELNINKDEIPEPLLKFIKEIPNTSVYQYIFKAIPTENPYTELDSANDLKTLFNDQIDEIIEVHEEPLFQKISSLNEKLEQEKKISLEMGQRITSLNEKVDQEKNLSQELKQYIATINEKLEQEKKKSKEIEQHVVEMKQQIAEMKQSIAYRLTMKFDEKIIGQIFPIGSEKRRTYDLGLKGGRILVNEGVRSFWWNFNNYLQTKKIINQTNTSTAYSINIEPNIIEDIKEIDKKVSVIIPTKNAGVDFGFLMEKIKNQKGIREIEIIIVDSGSTDGTLDIAKKYAKEIVKIPSEEFNHGGTRNLAAERANGDYFIFIVQDAIPIGEYCFHNMIRPLETEQRIAATTCRQVPRSDADLFARFSLWSHYKALDFERDKIIRIDENDFKKLTPLEKRKLAGLDDVCSCFKSEIFNNLKYNNLNFAEDLDMGIRLTEGGYNLCFLHSTGVIHSHNRKAEYFMRRSYVDTKSLIKMFDSASYIGEKKPEKIVSDVISLYIHLKNSISLLSLIHQKEINVDRFFIELKKNMKIEASWSLLDMKNESSLEKILIDLKNTCSTECVSNETIFHEFSNLVSSFIDYVKLGTQMCEIEEMTESIYKLYAIYCGAYLANFYYDNNDSLTQEIDQLLSRGV